MDKSKINVGTVQDEAESKELTLEELENVSGGTSVEVEKAQQSGGTLTPEI